MSEDQIVASDAVRPDLTETVVSKRENKAPAIVAKKAWGTAAAMCVGLLVTFTIELTTGPSYETASVRVLDTDLF